MKNESKGAGVPFLSTTKSKSIVQGTNLSERAGPIKALNSLKGRKKGKINTQKRRNSQYLIPPLLPKRHEGHLVINVRNKDWRNQKEYCDIKIKKERNERESGAYELDV